MQKHILIADDNTIARDIVKTALAATLDINDCQEATNGREAIERAEKTRPDLIILDVGMPEMDGITAAHRLKESMPEIPIILLSIYDLGQNSAKKLAWKRLSRNRKDGAGSATRFNRCCSINAEKLRRMAQLRWLRAVSIRL
jgi:CheY-like chemotaxis protein